MKLRKFLLPALVLTTVIIISGCGESTPTSKVSPSTPTTESPTIAQTVKTSSIIDQVRQSQHFKMFQTQVAEKEKDPSYDYNDSCIRCHSEIAILSDKNAKLTDFYTGGKYADQKEGITCLVCHNIGGEKMISLRQPGWNSCTTCHTSEGLTLGKEVHHSQKEMIEGQGVGEVQGKPSYKWASMKETFSCTDCHVTNGLKHDFMVPGVTATYDSTGTERTGTTMNYTEFTKMFKQEKCITCHYDPTSTINKIQSHQDEIAKELETLKSKFESIEKQFIATSANDPKVVQFNKAKTYYTYVTSDASKGAHNYALSKDLLLKAEDELAKIK
jgi:PBP1b-binding outer membrane lipoprotein LpoB